LTVVAVAALVTLGALAAAPLLARRAPDGEPAGGPAAQNNPAARPAPVQPIARPRPATPLKPEAIDRWGKAEAVVYAKLTFVQAGPVAQSFPPIYNHTLQLLVERPIRGIFKKGESITGRHAIKQKDEPTFPLNKDCLVALKRDR